jgi:hypothetical protein
MVGGFSQKVARFLQKVARLSVVFSVPKKGGIGSALAGQWRVAGGE